MQLIGTYFFLFIDVRFGLLSFVEIVLLEIISLFQFSTDHHLVIQSLVKYFIHSGHLVMANFMIINFVMDPSRLNCKIIRRN
jgi:hypothetical protein